MRDKIEILMQRFDVLSMRERILVSVALLVFVIVLWQAMLHNTLSASRVQVVAEKNQLQQQIQQLGEQISGLQAAASKDPNREHRQRIARLETQLARLDAELGEKMRGLIDPAQMARVLEEVLVQQKRGLKLLRVESLGATPLLAAIKADTQSDQQNQSTATAGVQSATAKVYQHPLQIEIEGNYLDTLKYLQALEALPWDFYWDNLQLTVMKYPLSKVVITIHTLSLEEGWIGV